MSSEDSGETAGFESVREETVSSCGCPQTEAKMPVHVRENREEAGGEAGLEEDQKDSWGGPCSAEGDPFSETVSEGSRAVRWEWRAWPSDKTVGLRFCLGKMSVVCHPKMHFPCQFDHRSY